MNKRDYLVKTFSRTKRKDYENYILTAIWHKLNNFELKPVSQQYIKRDNGTYALMDLYFPQIHIEIEVDEAYHQDNQKADQLRMDDILSAVSKEAVDDFLCLRINADQSIEKIHKRIDEIVSIIKERVSKTNIKWLTYEEELNLIKQKSYLSVNDDLSFEKITDITNTVFGKKYKEFQRGWLRINDHLSFWAPKLSTVIDGKAKSSGSGWFNLLADDWSYIDESNEDSEIVKVRKRNHLEEMELNQGRAVFAKYKDHLGLNRYRFVGVFKCSGLSPENDQFVRYQRVDRKIRIIKS